MVSKEARERIRLLMVSAMNPLLERPVTAMLSIALCRDKDGHALVIVAGADETSDITAEMALLIEEFMQFAPVRDRLPHTREVREPPQKH